MPGIRYPSVAAVCLLLGASACTTGYQPGAAVARYQQQLETTPAVAVGLDSPALQRFTAFVTDLDEARVREETLAVYAEDAYLNDGLVTRRGAESIREYFLKSTRRAEAVRVAIEDIVGANGEYYLRWTMTLEIPGLNDGEPIPAMGVTHVRFDDTGKVALQQDFWDTADGLLAHVPVLGYGIRRAKATL